MKYNATVFSILAMLAGCSGPLIVDRSTDAFAAADMTLVSSCVATPGAQVSLASGVDSCHFTVGDTIASAWTLVIPPPKTAKQVTGGTVDVYFKDLHKSFSVLDWTVQISWADFLGITKWSSDQNLGVVEAQVTMNWTDNENIGQVTRYNGIAVLLVTAQGYDRMPIDSGNQAWGSTCKVQYSTAGRSAIQCK